MTPPSWTKAELFLRNNLIRNGCPCFEIEDSRQIEIITEPIEYYVALHKLIEKS